MKIIILCGGLGTRILEETKRIPKPMVLIGNKPILWHIINIYLKFNFNDFFLAIGYKGQYIKSYFSRFQIKKLANVKCVNTGKKTMTGGRLLKFKKFIKKNETFMVTYGDGVSNININELIKFHKKSKKFATVTIVRPPARWGNVTLKKHLVSKFEEKNQLNEGWINGGFFVFNYKVFKFFKKGRRTILEQDVLPHLAKKNQLAAYKHKSFWQCMDTLRDKVLLNKIWNKNKSWS
jgi:glucose-1-phosphate cytidylyltransferase